MLLPFQSIDPPITERLSEPPRWSSEASPATAIPRMLREDYAFLGPTQTMYLDLGLGWNYY